jgi:dihydrofolate reductase
MAEKLPSIIVAYDRSRLIGGGNELLWQGELPADMKHFRAVTIGHIVVMGRKTYESIGQPLAARQNVVLTHSKEPDYPGCTVINHPDELNITKDDDRQIFIIGGRQIYDIYLPRSNKVLATEIDAKFEGDVYFPKLDDSWHETSREDHTADERNKYDYSFVIYEREI